MSKKAEIRKDQTTRIAIEATEETAEYGIHRREAVEALADMKSLAREIGKSWTSPKSALELLDQNRR